VYWRAVLRSTRPPFLILAPICVLLGASALYAQGHQPVFLSLLLALLGGISAHISVNTFNEYFDFRSGLDLLTRKTPFSGGSGSLPETPSASTQVLWAAIVSLLSALVIGLYFAFQVGTAILPIGITGLLLVFFYTQWINRYPLLCLIAPGIGFGIVMVVGTHIALGGAHTLTTWVVAAVPFMLINNLLLLNQYPDIAADQRVGRNHFPIAYGIERSNTVYLTSLLLVSLLVVASIHVGLLPLSAFLALLPMPLGVFAWYGARRHGQQIAEHPRFLAANVMLTLSSPALLAIGLALKGSP